MLFLYDLDISCSVGQVNVSILTKSPYQKQAILFVFSIHSSSCITECHLLIQWYMGSLMTHTSYTIRTKKSSIITFVQHRSRAKRLKQYPPDFTLFWIWDLMFELTMLQDLIYCIVLDMSFSLFNFHWYMPSRASLLLES